MSKNYIATLENICQHMQTYALRVPLYGRTLHCPVQVPSVQKRETCCKERICTENCSSSTPTGSYSYSSVLSAANLNLKQQKKSCYFCKSIWIFMDGWCVRGLQASSGLHIWTDHHFFVFVQTNLRIFRTKTELDPCCHKKYEDCDFRCNVGM